MPFLNVPIYKLPLIIFFVCIATTLQAQDKTNPDTVLGTYWSPTKLAKIQIFKDQGKYFGKTVWTKANGIDTLNPDPKKRTQSLLGLVFLTDFVYNDGNYVDGSIYDPKNGKVYSCKLWVENGNLKARGFIGISLFGRTETFERVR